MGFKWLAMDGADRSHSDTKQLDVRSDHWHTFGNFFGNKIYMNRSASPSIVQQGLPPGSLCRGGIFCYFAQSS